VLLHCCRNSWQQKSTEVEIGCSSQTLNRLFDQMICKSYWHCNEPRSGSYADDVVLCCWLLIPCGRFAPKLEREDLLFFCLLLDYGCQLLAFCSRLWWPYLQTICNVPQILMDFPQCACVLISREQSQAHPHLCAKGQSHPQRTSCNGSTPRNEMVDRKSSASFRLVSHKMSCWCKLLWHYAIIIVVIVILSNRHHHYNNN